MRAEMTVGLDLCSLENLKIFNGHEVVKKESKSPLGSSPEFKHFDIDSDEQQQQLQQTNKKGRQKCGRPANPVPRHKRDSHIKAEYKRRDKIQKCFDSLVCLVPELRDSISTKESKSAMLFKAAEYGRRLKGDCGNMQSEMEALRQELEALGTEIHDLQEQLPQQGLDVTEKDPVKMDSLYDQYVEKETKKNWKFWIFGFFMQPLYMSYRQAVSSVSSRQEFSTSVSDWMCNTLSLTNLRKGFFEALRKISVQTGIMNSPEKLEEEAGRTATVHCVQTQPAIAEPEAPPSPVKPKSKATTPIPSPSCQRRPSTGVRLARRESRKSKESRSRSITPPTEDSKQKRRSSHNRGERRVEQEVNFLGKRSRASSPRSMDMDTPFTQSYLVQSGKPLSSAATFTPVTLSGYVPIQMSQPGVNPSELVTTLTSILRDTSPSFVKPKSVMANNRSPSDLQIVPTLQDLTVPINQPVLNEVFVSVPIEAQQTPSIVSCSNHQQSFMPIHQSGIITSNSVLPLDQTMAVSYHTPMPDLQSLLNEDSMSCQTTTQFTDTMSQSTVTLSSPQMSLLSTNDPVQLSNADTKSSSANFLNSDEDSLMKMLTVDVMDINSVMTFFEDDPSLTMGQQAMSKHL